MTAGAAPHGDAFFTRPQAELVGEIQQELEDVAGWALLLWIRLERLRSRLLLAGKEARRGTR